MSLKISNTNLLDEGGTVRAAMIAAKNNTKFPSPPDTIIIHYTAGSSAESSARYLQDGTVMASAHIVVGKEGEIYQIVPFDKIAWHAGQSTYGGRSGYNQFSIGIELDNPGILTQAGNEYISTFGRKYSANNVIKAIHRNEQTPRFWHVYTEPQLAACEELCKLLITQYPTINQILGHEEISPGRKQDPGPAFPLDKFRNKILFNDRKSEVDEIALNINGKVTVDKLNIREGAGADFDKVAKPLALNTDVTIKGERNGWYRVSVTVEGWVSKAFIKS